MLADLVSLALLYSNPLKLLTHFPGCLTQVTGDVLSICTDIGGPILPGFGPTVFAEKAMTSKGLAAATAAGGPAAAAATSAAVSTEGASIPQAVVDFLMPPQGENPDIVSQVGPSITLQSLTSRLCIQILTQNDIIQVLNMKVRLQCISSMSLGHSSP